MPRRAKLSDARTVPYAHFIPQEAIPVLKRVIRLLTRVVIARLRRIYDGKK